MPSLTNLDKTQRLLQDALDSIHLGMIKFRETWCGETLGHLCSKVLRLQLMTKKLVILRKVNSEWRVNVSSLNVKERDENVRYTR